MAPQRRDKSGLRGIRTTRPGQHGEAGKHDSRSGSSLFMVNLSTASLSSEMLRDARWLDVRALGRNNIWILVQVLHTVVL